MTAIFCAFIDMIAEFVMFVMPEVTLAPDVIANLDKYISVGIDFLKAVNFIIPLPLIVAVLAAQIAIRSGEVILWGINWVIKRIFDVIPYRASGMRSFPFTPGAYALAWCQGRRWLRKRPDALHRSARMKAGSWCQGCRKFPKV